MASAIGSVFHTCRRSPDVKKKMVDTLALENQKVWDDLFVHEDDPVIIKNR